MKISELLKRVEELEREVVFLQLQLAALKVVEYVPYPVYPQPCYERWPQQPSGCRMFGAILQRERSI